MVTVFQSVVIVLFKLFPILKLTYSFKTKLKIYLNTFKTNQFMYLIKLRK